MTLMACLEPEGAMEQEQKYSSYLMEVHSFELDGDRLYLYFGDREALTFNRK